MSTAIHRALLTLPFVLHCLGACHNSSSAAESIETEPGTSQPITIAEVSAASVKTLAPVNHAELDSRPLFDPSRLPGAQRARIRDANVPVLLPRDLDASGVVLSQGDGWYAAAYRLDGHSVSVYGSRVTFIRPGGHATTQKRRSSKIQRSRDIVQLDFTLAGVSYVINVDCAQRLTDTRCLHDDYTHQIQATLALLVQEAP